MGCLFSFFKFTKSYKVAESPNAKDSSQQARKSSVKQPVQSVQQKKEVKPQQQQPLRDSGQQLPKKSPIKIELPAPKPLTIYKTVLEATVTDARANEEEAQQRAEEAPGPFEIETDLLSPEIEEAVIKIQANVRGYLTRKQFRVTPERAETIQKKPMQESEPKTTNAEKSSGILDPPLSFSDIPRNRSFNADDQASEDKKEAENLISQKQVNRSVDQMNKEVSDCKEPEHIVNDRSSQSIPDKLKSNEESAEDVGNANKSPQKPLDIPSIETTESPAPEEAAIKIQAAFRGYQVRKTISREPSPSKALEVAQDSTANTNEKAEVQLREKENVTQDPERESILVLDQLEECLSQELMKSSINLEDEKSFNSYSTDFDLNSSRNEPIEESKISSDETASKSDSKAITSYESSQSLQTPSELNISIISDNKETIQSHGSSLITLIDQPAIPEVDKTTDPSIIETESRVLKTEVKAKDQDEISNVQEAQEMGSEKNNLNQIEPVVLVPKDEEVNAIIKPIGMELVHNKETDPVILVEKEDKLDAVVEIDVQRANVAVEQKSLVELSESETEVKEQLLTESDLIPSEVDHQGWNTNEKLSMEPATIQTNLVNELISSSEPVQLVQRIIEGNDLKPSSKIISLNESQIADSNNNADPSSIMDAPQKPSQQATSTISDKQLFKGQTVDLYSTIESPSAGTDEPENGGPDIKASSNVPVDDGESKQKNAKLAKDDSFGSDILILGDENMDKGDLLYDIIADKGLPAITAPENALASSFADDNLVKSMVENLHREDALLLFEANTVQTFDSLVKEEASKFGNEESISEVKDDILVDLTESDEDLVEKDSSKQPINLDSILPSSKELENTVTSSASADENNMIRVDQVAAQADTNYPTVDSSLIETDSVDKPLITSPDIPVQVLLSKSEPIRELESQVRSTDQIEDNQCSEKARESTVSLTTVSNLDPEEKTEVSRSQEKKFDDQSSVENKVDVTFNGSVKVDNDELRIPTNPHLSHEIELESISQVPKPVEHSVNEPADQFILSKSLTQEETLATFERSMSSNLNVSLVDVPESKEAPSPTKVQEPLSMDSKPSEPKTGSSETNDSVAHLTKSDSTESKSDDMTGKTTEESESLTSSRSSETNVFASPTEALPPVKSESSRIEASLSAASELLSQLTDPSSIPTIDLTVSNESLTTTIIESSLEESGSSTSRGRSSTEEDVNRLFRLHDRDNRSKSPNPFGRRKKKGKRGRNGN